MSVITTGQQRKCIYPNVFPFFDMIRFRLRYLTCQQKRV